MTSPCKNCEYKHKDKRKFWACIGCKKVAQFVAEMESENQYHIYGDTTPQVNYNFNNLPGGAVGLKKVSEEWINKQIDFHSLNNMPNYIAALLELKQFRLEKRQQEFHDAVFFVSEPDDFRRVEIDG